MKITTPAREFKTALKQVASACSDDDARPVLQLARVTVTAGALRIESADGFRAHRVDLPGKYKAAPEILLTPEQINFVLKFKILKRDEFTATLDTDAGTLAIDNRTAPGTFDTESRYPDINQVWPTDTPVKFDTDRDELLTAVRTARVFAHEGSNVARFYVNNGLIVHGKSEETGESWNPVNIGKRALPYNVAIAFNCDFVIDFLKNAAPGRVTVEISKPTAPAIFSDESNFAAVVMPMHLERSNNEPVPSVLDIPRAPETDRRDTAEYYETADAWKLSHTVKHDPEFGTEAGNYTSDLTTSPAPGAEIVEIESVFAYEQDQDAFSRSKPCKVIALHLANGTPDPDAPIPVTLPTPHRHPVFIDTGRRGTLTVGTCTQCLDADPHALIDGICNPCRVHNAAA